MPKFRKKPVVVDAYRYPGGETIPPAPHSLLRRRGFFRRRWQVKTMEGWYDVSPGDYIIRGVQGEFYPCNPDIFKETYEPA